MQFKCIIKNLEYGSSFLGLNISTLHQTLHMYFQARCLLFNIYKNQAEFQLIFRIPPGLVSFMKIDPSYLRE